MNVQKVKASDFSRRLVTASCLLVFCSCKSQLEVLGIGEDFLLVGVLFLLHGTLDDQRQCQHIDGQRENGDHPLGYGIDQGGTDGGIHESVSVQHRNGGEDAAILEQGEYLGKHTPKSQGVGTVLDPAALIP